MIYFLFFLVLVMFVISYILTNDLFSPACIICESYILAVFCAILNIDLWNINLSSKTVFIIFLGLLMFLIPSILLSLYFQQKREKEINLKEENLIKYNKFNMGILIAVQIVFIVIYLIFVIKQLNNFGGLSNYTVAMSKFRNSVSYDGEIKIPFVIKQLSKLSKAIVYIFTYIELHNIILSKMKKEKYKIPVLCIVSIILFFIQSILSGGRSELMIYIIYDLIMFWTIKNHYTVGKKKKSATSIIKLAIVLFIVVYAFSSFRSFFGRTSQENFVSYISRYFGGSIELLDLYLKEPIEKSNIFGKETFFSINDTLHSLGFIEEDFTVHLEFRSSNKVGIGNVYTAFRRMYQDFGYSGIIILQFLLGCIFELMYQRIKSMKKINFISLYIIIYGMIIHSLFLHSFSDFFYSTILSVNYINIFVYVFFVKFFIEKVKFKNSDKIKA